MVTILYVTNREIHNKIRLGSHNTLRKSHIGKIKACSSPIKEKHSKTPTGRYLVPHERRSTVNTNGESKEESLRRISGNLQSQRIYELAPKGSNSKVTAGQSQRRYKLAPKGINSEVPTGEFCANKVWNSILGFKFWARVRVFQYLKRRISLCTDHFSSEPIKWKPDRNWYDFKNPPSHPWINSLLHLETNSLLFCFHSFYPWGKFTRILDYPGGQGRF